MKNTKITTFCLGLAILGSTLAFTSCKKDKKDPEPEPEPVVLTNTQKLSNKNFKLTAATIDPGVPVGGATITDWYAQMDDCQKDDLLMFSDNGTYKDDEGATKCNTSDPQTTTGTWVWNTNETIITVTTGTTVISFDVLTNDGTTLKVKLTEKIGNTNYVLTETFVKQ